MSIRISYRSGSEKSGEIYHDKFVVKYSDEDRERTMIEAIEREIEDFTKLPFSERLEDLAQFAVQVGQQQMGVFLRNLIAKLAEDEKSDDPIRSQQPRNFRMEVDRFVKTHLVSRMHSLLIGYMAQGILNPDETLLFGAYHAALLQQTECLFTPAQRKDFVSRIPDALVKRLFGVTPGRAKGSKTSEKARAAKAPKHEATMIAAAREIHRRNRKAKITIRKLAEEIRKDTDTIAAWLGKTPVERKARLAEIITRADESLAHAKKTE